MKNEKVKSSTRKQSDLSFIEYSTLLELEQLVDRTSYKYSIFQLLTFSLFKFCYFIIATFSII